MNGRRADIALELDAEGATWRELARANLPGAGVIGLCSGCIIDSSMESHAVRDLASFIRGGVAALALVPAGAVAAEPAAAPPDPERVEFVLGNVTFAVLHEFGHAVIRDFDVPILGLEENSADTLAAVTLILAEKQRDGKASNSSASLTRLLAMAGVGNVLTWRSGVERENPELIFWAQHDLSVRRAARIVCLLVGSDPQAFGWLVDSGAVPDLRADNCEDEYEVAEHAVLWVYRTHGRFRDSRPDDQGREIRVEYGDPRSDTQADLLRRLRERGLVEKLAGFYDAAFRFPQTLTVKVMACGTPNAYWDEEGRELRLCYELLEVFARMSHDPEVDKAYRSLREQLAQKPAS